MNITASSDCSFLLDTKTASIALNQLGGDIAIFSTFQEGEENHSVFHWPGEYETKGVSVFISPVLESQSIVKIFAEGIRVVLFSDKNLSGYSDEILLPYFENTDILICSKEENGIADSAYKKLIEKIDPRIIIATEGLTTKTLSSFSFPLQSTAKISLNQEKLPTDTTEYYSLSA